MKKQLMILVMLFLGVLPMSSQTYYYKYLYTVDKNSGMKSNYERPGKYLTFTNDRRVLYESDKNGISKSRYAYRYAGSTNGMYVFKEESEQNMFGQLGGWGTYSFSTDYQRMNFNTTITDGTKNEVHVYELGQEPEIQNAPNVLY